MAAAVRLEGFERGSIGNRVLAATNGTVALETSFVRTGNGALKITLSGSGTGYVEPGEVAATGLIAQTMGQYGQAVCGFGFAFSALPTTGEAFFKRTDNNGHWIALILNADGTVSLHGANSATWDGSATTRISTSAATLSANTYYYLEVLSEASGSGGDFALWIDGVEQAGMTASRATGAGNGWRRVFLGKVNDTNSETINYWFDDYYLNAELARLGDSQSADASDGGIVLLTANANGNYTAFSGGTGGSDYTQVDEVVGGAAYSAADYTQSTANGDKATYGLTDLSDVDVILHVEPCVAMDDQASGQSRIISRSGTTDTESTTTDITAGWRYLSHSVDPATTAAWTQSGLNALEVGAAEMAGAGSRVRIFAANAQVFYVAGGSPADIAVLRRRIEGY